MLNNRAERKITIKIKPLMRGSGFWGHGCLCGFVIANEVEKVEYGFVNRNGIIKDVVKMLLIIGMVFALYRFKPDLNLCFLIAALSHALCYDLSRRRKVDQTASALKKRAQINGTSAEGAYDSISSSQNTANKRRVDTIVFPAEQFVN